MMNSDKRKEIIASNIKKYLKENDMTQSELATSIGISKSVLNDYLKLRTAPSYTVIQKLADAFGVSNYDIDTTFKEKNILITFSKNLKNYMEINNETVSSLSEALDIPYTTVSDWLNGRKMPRPFPLNILADHYSISTSDLLKEDIENDNHMVSKNIRVLRKKNSLTQDQLANKMDVTKQTISNWETGSKLPRLDKIQKLASIFNVDQHTLITSHEPEESQYTPSNNTKIIEKLITTKITDEQLDSIMSFIGFITKDN